MKTKPQTIEGLEITESDEGYAIYDPTNEKVHFLNGTGIIILELCNGQNTVENIIELISKTFNLSLMPREEIIAYIENLDKEGLLQ